MNFASREVSPGVYRLYSIWTETQNADAAVPYQVTWTWNDVPLGASKVALPGMVVISKEFGLEQNYPNPFNPSTLIRYEVFDRSRVTLKVYNAIGQEVAVLVDGVQEAGPKTVHFSARDLPSGVYFYKLRAVRYSDVKKMLVLR